MSYRLATNAYTHAVNQVNISETIRNKFSERGYRFLTTRSLTISGELLGDSVSDVAASIAALEAGYYDGLLTSIGLYESDDDGVMGDVTHLYLVDGPTCFGGIRVLSLDYPKGDATEMFNCRTFQIQVEADFIDQSGGELQEFRQQIEYIGDGGPRRALLETLTGPVVAQIVNKQTIRTINQSGSAVGLTKWPEQFIPAPVKPNALDRPGKRLVYESAREWKGNRSILWPVSWNFTMSF